MKRKIFILLPLIASLAACGGSDLTSSGTSNAGTVALLVTDNLTQNYSEIWVNIQAITATDANNQAVTLYQDASGQTHNLSQLVNVGALVDAQAVAAGTYTSFQITLANSITMVAGGGVTNATFDQSGNPTYTMTVPGSLTVDANQVATLALDFNLQQFTYDAATNTVTPVVVQKDPNTLNQVTSKIYGEVERIISASEFVLDPEGDGRHLTVVLHNNATVTNAASGAVLADTSGLSANMHVSVAGTFDAATLTITASSVSSVQGGNSAVSVRHEVEGVISSVTNGILVIDVHEANFMPGANTLTIDVNNAAFSRGSLGALTAGQKVEIKGGWDGASFTAAVVEIDGYAGNDDSNSYEDEYAEIKGEITAVNGDQLTVTVREHEHVGASGFNASTPLAVDSSNSWFEHGDSSCLVVGAVIEVKGGMTDAANMAANVIKIDSGCGESSDSGDDENDD